MKKQIIKILFVLTLFSCSMNSLRHSQIPERKIATTSDNQFENVKNFPELTIDNGELSIALNKALKKSAKTMSEADFNDASERLRHYLMFLGLSAKDFQKVSSNPSPDNTSSDEASAATQAPAPRTGDVEESGDEDDTDKTPSNLKAIQRLLISSTQFLGCDDLTNWECLEKTPVLKPSAPYRIESKANLGSPIAAGNSLDMDVFFTEGWDGTARSGVVDRFNEKLQKDVGKSLSIAMYGIDDINGSMSGVYKTITNYANTSSVNVRAVIDVSGFEKGQSPWIFDYVRPTAGNPNLSNWLFGDSTTTPGGMHATFQYDGTPNFIHQMNDRIKTPEESRVRLEWSTAHIMHNKYAVMENFQGKKSVWAGTANFSNHCMGTEANANMSIYIRNDQIAQAFLDEFNLMYNFDPNLTVKSKLVTSSDDKHPIVVGRFHHNKFPVSNRFFTFKDGTKLRVHFAPTDDAEHRVILPMLLSAKEGDEIRISMFGGTGYEIVRAMQYAAAKGANVRIVYDSKLGHGLTSWTRDQVLNVFMDNPYTKKMVNPPRVPGKISVRISTWKGKNHYKVGTLSRKLSNGSMRAEEIIVGSQNWSSGGNDHNDENLISIQNLNADVKAAKMFNQEFDTRLWVSSKDEFMSKNR